jgi:Holliday junction DNA helicase RuvB
LVSLRPQRLEDYIGQEHIKDILRTAIEASKKLKEPLDHVLLNGPPGLGKTTLARIIAKELGWKIKTTIGGSIKTVKDTQFLAFGLAERSVLFIDEIHRVAKPAQEQLYPVLEDGVFHYKMGNSVSPVELPNLVVIGATTHIGRLTQPFVDRFGLQFQLEYYADHEMYKILSTSRDKLEVEIGGVALMEVVARCRATPRIGNRLLKRLRDYNVARGTQLTIENVRDILWKKFHLDQLGLLPLDRRVLRVLARVNVPLGIEAIAAMVSEAEETIADSIEPYLLRQGLVERGPRGRIITAQGIKHLKELR